MSISVETVTDDICGYEDTTTGQPCRHPAGSCPVPSHRGAVPNGGNPQGRPTKLNLQRQEDIAQAVERGKSFTSACRKAGITPQTGIRWMQVGEDEDEGPYREFFERLTRAKGIGQDLWEQRLHEVTEDPATIMAILKTQYPDTEWGDANRGEQAGDGAVINLPESVTDRWQRHQQ